jgi:amino acid permease
MTYESSSRAGRSAGKTTAVAILAVIAILAIVAGAIYFAEPAKSLPSVLGTITSPASRANAHRSTRGWVAIAVGVVLLVAAWFTARMGRTAQR